MMVLAGHGRSGRTLRLELLTSAVPSPAESWQPTVPSGSGVSAVVLNITVHAPTSSGLMSVHGAGEVQPRMPNLNFAAAQVVQNLVIAPVRANGKVDLYNNSGGIVRLIADFSGYYLEAISAAATI